MEKIVKDIEYGAFLGEGFSRINAVYETTNTICEKIPEVDRDIASMLAISIIDSLVKQFDDLCKQHCKFEHEGHKYRLAVMEIG